MGLTGFLLIMAGVALEVLAQVAFKRGVTRITWTSGEERVLRYWSRLILNSWVQFGIALQVLALLLWIAALNFVPLSVAFPLASLSYCGVAIAAHYWLGERLGRRSIAAIATISIGAALVCWPRG